VIEVGDIVSMPGEDGRYEVVALEAGQARLRSIARGGHYKVVLATTPRLEVVAQARADVG
jgi:hypothetical protein